MAMGARVLYGLTAHGKQHLAGCCFGCQSTEYVAPWDGVFGSITEADGRIRTGDPFITRAVDRP